jgi:hypothetical protein
VSTVPVTAVLSYTFDVKEYDFDNQIEANKKIGKQMPECRNTRENV